MTKHDDLRKRALQAVSDLHSDRSASLYETREALGEVRDYIEVLMDAAASCMPTDDEEEHYG